MGQRPRQVPERLAEKLLTIRQTLKASQAELSKDLGLTAARVHEYEKGKREPNLLVLLGYARLAKIPVERIIDDKKELMLK